MKKNNACRKQVRQGTVGKAKNRPSLPFISCGTLEKKILLYLQKINGDRFNVRGFSSIVSVHRSTIYSALTTLAKKNLINKDNYGQHTLTTAGCNYLEAVGDHRTVCRSDGQESSYVRDHKFTFEIPVRKWPQFWKAGQVAFLNKEEIQKTINNFSKNNSIIYAKFPSDVNVVFTTTKIIIKPKNIFCNDHSEAASKAITKAYEIISLLIEAGFGIENHKGNIPLIQSEGHYAEVNSLLAQFFEKHARGFKVEGPDKKTLFWVDHSDGHREDETATEEARTRLNNWLYDVMDNDIPKPSEISEDLERLKSITSDLVKMQVLARAPAKVKPTNLNEVSYIG